MGLTAQDQQSRAEFEAWAKTMPAMYSRYMRRIGDGYETPCIQAAWNGWRAARALPAGMKPFGYVRRRNGKFYHEVEGLPAADFDVVYTAAQVLAMGRVPPGWQAVPVDPTREMATAYDAACFLDYFREEGYRAALAAAPQPPAAQELGEVVITKNEAGAIVAVTRQDEEGRILSVLAESAAQEREPLDQVAAMKLGMAADDATRKHCRGTTNWAHALTRFYEKALERMPTWEPKFDVMAPRQEELAVQFCNEISGPLGKPGRAPDPVRLLEMAEELYKVERDAARCKEGGAA